MITANKRTGKKPARRNDFWFRHWQKHLVFRVLQPPDFFPVIFLHFFIIWQSVGFLCWLTLSTRLLNNAFIMLLGKYYASFYRLSFCLSLSHSLAGIMKHTHPV